MLLTRIKPSLYMSGWMMAWAIVSTLMAIVKNYHGMLACRWVIILLALLFLPNV